MFSDADLEWKLIYVGSAEDEKYDQVLESVLVGPVNVGNYRFVFQVCNNPTILKIMKGEGSTCIISWSELHAIIFSPLWRAFESVAH